MMTKLREMSVIFLCILVFAFLGLMVMEWGMDYTGLQSQSNVVGKIDGRKITIEEFQQALQQAYAQERERTGQEPDEETMNRLRDEVWESFIQQVVFERAVKKYDIQVTDRELAMFIMNNPPAELRQNPNLQTEGQFDMQKYREALRNPEIDWRPVEEYYRQILPFQKLQEIIASAAIVTEQEIKDEYIRKNLRARIEYLFIPSSKFSDEEITVTDKEIKDYYQENKKDFKVEEKRVLDYVLFPVQATPEDSARVYRLAKDLMEDAKSADFSQLAEDFSEDPSVRNNSGDLGYFDRNAMVPEFSEAAFSASPGDIVGPVKTRFGLHIIKVVDKKIEDGTEKVRASHILLKFEPSANTVENVQYTAGNFAEMAKEEGFQLTADRLNYEVKQTPAITDGNYIPGIGIIQGAVKWAFSSKKGEVSEPYRNQQGYLVFHLAEIQPAGYRPLADVKDICKSRIENRKRLELAKQFASKLEPVITESGDFQKATVMDTAGIAIIDSTEKFTMDSSIPKIGRAPVVTAAAFKLPQDRASGMLETDRGFYFVKVLERDEFNQKNFETQKASIRNRLMQQKQQQLFVNWYNQMKEDLKIEDNRDLFYRG